MGVKVYLLFFPIWHHVLLTPLYYNDVAQICYYRSAKNRAPQECLILRKKITVVECLWNTFSLQHINSLSLTGVWGKLIYHIVQSMSETVQVLSGNMLFPAPRFQLKKGENKIAFWFKLCISTFLPATTHKTKEA